jgi:hypothetical protein
MKQIIFSAFIIVLTEYKKMLDVMVQGGRDPLLLDIDGVLGADKKVLLQPLRLGHGEELDKSGDPGAVIFKDSAGKTLSTWNFPLIPADKDPTWNKFVTRAPVPDHVASATLQLPGAEPQTFTFPAVPPEITWHDATYDKVKDICSSTLRTTATSS